MGGTTVNYLPDRYYIHRKDHQEVIDDRITWIYTNEQHLGWRGFLIFWFTYLTRFWKFKKSLIYNVISEN